MYGTEIPTSAQLITDTRAAWAPAQARGYRVDMIAAAEAFLKKKTDGMYGQLQSAMRDGRVYPTIRVDHTVTGRMAMTGPNLQGMSAAYRRALLADEGKVLIDFDLNHIEPTVAALWSGDQTLLADVADGSDPYMKLAQRLWGEQATKADRPRAKLAMLAPMYGQGGKSLAQQLFRLGTEEPNESQLAQAIWAKKAAVGIYPQLESWLKAASQASKIGTHSERVPGTRKKRLVGGDIFTMCGKNVRVVDKNERGELKHFSAGNHILQGTAADIFMILVLNVKVALDAVGIRDSLWLPIHDEIVCQVDGDRAEEAQSIMNHQMNHVFSSRSAQVTTTGKAEIFGERFLKELV